MRAGAHAIVGREVECLVSVDYQGRFAKVELAQSSPFGAYGYRGKLAVCERCLAALAVEPFVCVIARRILIIAIRFGE